MHMVLSHKEDIMKKYTITIDETTTTTTVVEEEVFPECDGGYCNHTWEEYCSTVPELCYPTTTIDTTTTTVEVATGTPPVHTLPATGGTPIIGIIGMLYVIMGLGCRFVSKRFLNR